MLQLVAPVARPTLATRLSLRLHVVVSPSWCCVDGAARSDQSMVPLVFLYICFHQVFERDVCESPASLKGLASCGHLPPHSGSSS